MEQEIENEFNKLERLVGEYLRGCKAMEEVGWLEEPSQELIASLKYHSKIFIKDIPSESMKYLANCDVVINAMTATCLDELQFMPIDCPSSLRFVATVMIDFIYDELPKYHRWNQYGLVGRGRAVNSGTWNGASGVLREHKKSQAYTTMQISEDVKCFSGDHKVLANGKWIEMKTGHGYTWWLWKGN